MSAFRKKPVVIEAVQWFKLGDHPAVTTACPDAPSSTDKGWIDTLEGGHYVTPGDWIIRGGQGEFYPCKPDLFAAIYEPADTPLPASQSDTGVHASHCCAQHGCKYGESDCPVACGNIAGIVCEECEEASQSAPSDGGGPEPGEPAPPPSTPAQHYLASVNGVATQEWQDGFNEASRLASAPASQSLTDKVSALLAEHSLSEVVVALQRANDSVVLSYLGGKELG